MIFQTNIQNAENNDGSEKRILSISEINSYPYESLCIAATWEL